MKRYRTFVALGLSCLIGSNILHAGETQKTTNGIVFASENSAYSKGQNIVLSKEMQHAIIQGINIENNSILNVDFYGRNSDLYGQSKAQWLQLNNGSKTISYDSANTSPILDTSVVVSEAPKITINGTTNDQTIELASSGFVWNGEPSALPNVYRPFLGGSSGASIETLQFEFQTDSLSGVTGSVSNTIYTIVTTNNVPSSSLTLTTAGASALMLGSNGTGAIAVDFANATSLTKTLRLDFGGETEGDNFTGASLVNTKKYSYVGNIDISNGDGVSTSIFNLNLGASMHGDFTISGNSANTIVFADGADLEGSITDSSDNGITTLDIQGNTVITGAINGKDLKVDFGTTTDSILTLQGTANTIKTIGGSGKIVFDSARGSHTLATLGSSFSTIADQTLEFAINQGVQTFNNAFDGRSGALIVSLNETDGKTANAVLEQTANNVIVRIQKKSNEKNLTLTLNGNNNLILPQCVDFKYFELVMGENNLITTSKNSLNNVVKSEKEVYVSDNLRLSSLEFKNKKGNQNLIINSSSNIILEIIGSGKITLGSNVVAGFGLLDFKTIDGQSIEIESVGEMADTASGYLDATRGKIILSLNGSTSNSGVADLIVDKVKDVEVKFKNTSDVDTLQIGGDENIVKSIEGSGKIRLNGSTRNPDSTTNEDAPFFSLGNFTFGTEEIFTVGKNQSLEFYADTGTQTIKNGLDKGDGSLKLALQGIHADSNLKLIVEKTVNEIDVDFRSMFSKNDTLVLQGDNNVIANMSFKKEGLMNIAKGSLEMGENNTKTTIKSDVENLGVIFTLPKDTSLVTQTLVLHGEINKIKSIDGNGKIELANATSSTTLGEYKIGNRANTYMTKENQEVEIALGGGSHTINSVLDGHEGKMKISLNGDSDLSLVTIEKKATDIYTSFNNTSASDSLTLNGSTNSIKEVKVLGSNGNLVFGDKNTSTLIYGNTEKLSVNFGNNGTHSLVLNGNSNMLGSIMGNGKIVFDSASGSHAFIVSQSAFATTANQTLEFAVKQGVQTFTNAFDGTEGTLIVSLNGSTDTVNGVMNRALDNTHIVFNNAQGRDTLILQSAKNTLKSINGSGVVDLNTVSRIKTQSYGAEHNIQDFALLEIGKKINTKENSINNQNNGLNGNVDFKMIVNTNANQKMITLAGQSQDSLAKTYGYTYSDRIVIHSANDTEIDNIGLILFPNNEKDIQSLAYNGGGTETQGNIAVLTIANSANVDVSSKSNVSVNGSDIVLSVVESTTDQYGKAQEGGDYTTYFLGKAVDKGATFSTKKLGAMAMSFNYSFYVTNFNSLDKRMGELRDNNFAQGVWTRVFGGNSKNNQAETTSDYVTTQFGYDYAFGFENANNYLGLAVAYGVAKTKENQFQETGVTIANGILGIKDVESSLIEASIYNSYVQDSGWFNDAIFKFNYLRSKFGWDAGGENSTANYAFILSDEFGYRYKFGSEKQWYIDPQLEVGFGYMLGNDIDNLNNFAGMNVHQDDLFIIRGRVGTTLGYQWQGEKSKVSFYIGAFYEYDYTQGGDIVYTNINAIKVTDNFYQSDERMIVNVGSNIELQEHTRLYIDVEKSFFGRMDTHLQFSAGVRFSFGEKGESRVVEEDKNVQ